MIVTFGCIWLVSPFEKAGVLTLWFTEFVTLLYAANYAEQCSLCSCLIPTFSKFKTAVVLFRLEKGVKYGAMY